MTQTLSNQSNRQTYASSSATYSVPYSIFEIDQPAANQSVLARKQDGLFALLEQSKAQVKADANAKSLAPTLAPVRTMLKLRDFWAVTDLEMEQMCGLPVDSRLPFPSRLAVYFSVPDIQQRMRCLMSVRARLSALFQGEQTAERQWLRTPWNRLEEGTPLQCMTGAGLPALVRLDALVRELVGG